jgi:hypothetical protein
MVTPRTVLDFIAAEPFRPFRIQIASGRTFKIEYPEMIKLARSSVAVYSRPEDNSNQAERWQNISLTLLESVEPLETRTTN